MDDPGFALFSAPLGRFSSPFALLIVLPSLALALEAFGWRERLAYKLVRIRRPLLRLGTPYALWLVTSAILTLDVAAVAAASVGIAVGREDEGERRWQLGGAILGANVGSLLLPFSNLTNMVLIAASGIGLAGYVRLVIWPQLAAALAVGLLFVARARRSVIGRQASPAASSIGSQERLPRSADHTTRAAGGIALAGAIGAVVVGLAGGDMAVPFAASAAALVGVAVATRADPPTMSGDHWSVATSSRTSARELRGDQREQVRRPFL